MSSSFYVVDNSQAAHHIELFAPPTDPSSGAHRTPPKPRQSSPYPSPPHTHFRSCASRFKASRDDSSSSSLSSNDDSESGSDSPQPPPRRPIAASKQNAVFSDDELDSGTQSSGSDSEEEQPARAKHSSGSAPHGVLKKHVSFHPSSMRASSVNREYNLIPKPIGEAGRPTCGGYNVQKAARLENNRKHYLAIMVSSP